MQLNSLLTRLYSLLSENKIILVYLPLTIYWITIIVVTTIPTSIKPHFGHQDKIHHLLAFILLSSLLQLALHFQDYFEKFKKSHATFAIIIASIYGAVNEITQLFIPGRYGDIFDWIADVIGVLIGVFFTSYFIKVFGKNSVNINT